MGLPVLPTLWSSWQYSCSIWSATHVEDAGSRGSPDTRRITGGCAGLQPGAGQARWPVACALLATAATARRGRLHQRICHAVERTGSGTTDPGVHIGLSREPPPRDDPRI